MLDPARPQHIIPCIYPAFLEPTEEGRAQSSQHASSPPRFNWTKAHRGPCTSRQDMHLLREAVEVTEEEPRELLTQADVGGSHGSLCMLLLLCKLFCGAVRAMLLCKPHITTTEWATETYRNRSQPSKPRFEGRLHGRELLKDPLSKMDQPQHVHRSGKSEQLLRLAAVGKPVTRICWPRNRLPC